MTLFDKITAPAPPPPQPAQAPAPPANPDAINLQARDAFIQATARVRGNYAAQLATWNAFVARGVNRATLDKAVALLCRLTNAELDARDGHAEPTMRTGAEWAADSVHAKRQHP